MIESNKLLLQGGEVLISRLNPHKNCTALVCADAKPILCSTEFVAFTPDSVDPRYLRYCFQSELAIATLSAYASSATRSHARVEPAEIERYKIYCPSMVQQQEMADYLDSETARIDELVSGKERMLKLLEEKQAAEVSRAVTRGLNSRSPLKPSGLPWLGEIPRHWEMKRLKFVAEIRGGITLGKDYGNKDVQEFPYLRVANVQDGHIDVADVAKISLPPLDADSYFLRAGDVLMNEGGDADKLGRGAVWHGEIHPCLHQNHVFAVRPFGVSSEWLDAWTTSLQAKSYFESRAKRATNLASISATNIKELPVPIPPLEEQHAILERLAAERQRTVALGSALKESIGLLKERRRALITAAVTGEIEV